MLLPLGSWPLRAADAQGMCLPTADFQGYLEYFDETNDAVSQDRDPGSIQHQTKSYYQRRPNAMNDRAPISK